VRNPNRQRSHGCGPSRSLQAIIALTAEVGEFQAVAQQKLFALVAHGQATEAQHQAARGCHAQEQTPARPALAITLTFGAGHSCNSPRARRTRIKA
jgi:hypothetical protein